MVQREEIKKELQNIKMQVLKLSEDIYNEKAYELAEELYRRYLKLYVKISPSKVKSDEEWPYYNNCYFYALDLPTPKEFSLVCQNNLTSDRTFFKTYVGLISKEENSKNALKSEKALLDLVYADIDALNIKAFDSSIFSENKHNGYKIAIFYDGKSFRPDYHFVRQNEDGIWSSKLGYEPEFTYSDNPLNYINNNNPFRKYELIKTLELVKPTIKK